jgi:hypothetical protein
VALDVGEAVDAVESKTPAPAVDKSWKYLIEGKAHGLPAHKVRTYRDAITKAKSGRYKRVDINKQLKTSTKGRVKSIKRPDVTGARHDGRYDMTEAPHPKQTVQDMQDKINNMESQLGNFGWS